MVWYVVLYPWMFFPNKDITVKNYKKNHGLFMFVSYRQHESIKISKARRHSACIWWYLIYHTWTVHMWVNPVVKIYSPEANILNGQPCKTIMAAHWWVHPGVHGRDLASAVCWWLLSCQAYCDVRQEAPHSSHATSHNHLQPDMA